MKPVPFEYHRPATLAEASAILAGDADAVVLAGGQTLIPMLNMRLARPSRVVDIGALHGLDGLTFDYKTGMLHIGAITRHATVETDPRVAEFVPLLAKAMPHVAHPPIRARGTIGGSLANADPAAEIPLVAVTLDALLLVGNGVTSRRIRAGDFFRGPMETALRQGEVLTEIVLSGSYPAGTGAAFHEVAIRDSDYALVSVAVQLAIADRRFRYVSIGVGGAVERPTRLATDWLKGQRVEAGVLEKCAAGAAELDIRPPPHTTEAYCRRAVAALLRKALREAVIEAMRRSRSSK